MSPKTTLVGTTRERMILFGGGGTGKTHACLQIARRIPTAKFHVLDNDISFAWEDGLSSEFADVAEVGNVEVTEISDDWEDYMKVLQGVCLGPQGEKVTPAQYAEWRAKSRNEWLVIDSVTPTWQSAQDYFTNRVFGQNKSEYFLEMRKQYTGTNAKGKATDTVDTLDGWKDWSFINGCYFESYAALKAWPGNFILTAEVGNLAKSDDKEVQGIFGSVGFRPAGQKKLTYASKTVIMMNEGARGARFFSNLKDRYRERVMSEPYTDFALDYLVGFAGWKPERIS